MKIKFEKIKKICAKFPWFVAEHAFLTCLFLFLLTLVLGCFLVYKYIILVRQTEPEEINQSFLLKEDAYNEVLKAWKKEEQKFKETDSEEFLNPFVNPSSEPQEEKLTE